jgi:transposase
MVIFLAKKKSGYKRFIEEKGKVETNTEYQLDEDKIVRESRFDGYYVIQTSDKSLSAIDVIAQYGYLYKIEESFRLLKTTMRSRPVFHWSTKRINCHFLLCFIGLRLNRTLEYKLKQSNILHKYLIC